MSDSFDSNFDDPARREMPPTQRQIDYATHLGASEVEMIDMTRGEVSDLISQLLAGGKTYSPSNRSASNSKPIKPPTRKQLKYAVDLGASADKLKTMSRERVRGLITDAQENGSLREDYMSVSPRLIHRAKNANVNIEGMDSRKAKKAVSAVEEKYPSLYQKKMLQRLGFDAIPKKYSSRKTLAKWLKEARNSERFEDAILRLEEEDSYRDESLLNGNFEYDCNFREIFGDKVVDDYFGWVKRLKDMREWGEEYNRDLYKKFKTHGYGPEVGTLFAECWAIGFEQDGRKKVDLVNFGEDVYLVESINPHVVVEVLLPEKDTSESPAATMWEKTIKVVADDISPFEAAFSREGAEYWSEYRSLLREYKKKFKDQHLSG